MKYILMYIATPQDTELTKLATSNSHWREMTGYSWESLLDVFAIENGKSTVHAFLSALFA